ncbi:MAG: Tn3 family transposase [Pseudonocardiaceae bacterium]|nr:Tn3 family transposase [Pseudonocardiaceae bacterium]
MARSAPLHPTEPTTHGVPPPQGLNTARTSPAYREPAPMSSAHETCHPPTASRRRTVQRDMRRGTCSPFDGGVDAHQHRPTRFTEWCQRSPTCGDRRRLRSHPTALGEAIAAYGRIFKSLHILNYIDVDETYRRDIKGIRNLQEGRHALARKICHGNKDELYHRYERGLENQLGVLGLVLNCVVLWTTVYLDAAVRQLKAQGYPVWGEDMARLSPFVSTHLGVHGTYSFVLPDLAPGAIRDLRNPDAPDEDDE